MVKKKLINIKFIKDLEDLNNKGEPILKHKKGEIVKASGENAPKFIELGYAEYIEEPKEMKGKDDPQLNWEQKQAIENKTISPELRDLYKTQGRQKQLNNITKEILDEERIKEQVEKKTIEKEEIAKKDKLQKEYEQSKAKKENELYFLKMEIVSLLAQKKRREATEKIVEYVENHKYIYTTMEDLKSEMWIYNNGIYNPNGKSSIDEICRKILGEHYTVHLTNEVTSKISADTYISSDEFFKNNYIEEVPVTNGILNIKTKKLFPFDPKKIFFNKIPVTYNPNAICPNIDKHFQDVLKNKNDAKIMFEIFGFFLYKDYFIEKAIMFVGDGRNGKGKTIELMKRFLGIDNCCSVPLNVLSDGGFRVWDLFGKMANLAGDLSSNALKDTAILKQTTGRDLIGADRKNKITVNFVNYAKHIFACNDLPRVYDFSRGFWERWILFEFPYTFTKKKYYDNLNDEEKKTNKVMDVFIIEKLTTKEELSGLLNKAIEGLHTLLKQKDFSYSVGVDEIKKFWVRKSDSFTAFAMDHLGERYDGSIPKPKIRKAFLKYCKQHKIRGASDKNIKVVLEEMFGATDRQDYETKMRIWDGIKFKKDSEYNFMEERVEQE